MHGRGWNSYGDNMSETILTVKSGSKWKPSSSSDTVHCVSCDNAFVTDAEVASHPKGGCPVCGEPWTGAERRSTSINVTAPEAISGET